MPRTPDQADQLADGLADLAEQMAPDQAARAIQEVLDAWARSKPVRGLDLGPVLFAHALPVLAARLEGGPAARAAQRILDFMAQMNDPTFPTELPLREGLADPRAELGRAVELLAGRCTPQGVVDLLKQPTCINEGRKRVLRALARRLGPPMPEVAASAIAAGSAPPTALIPLTVRWAAGDALYPGGRRPFADQWEAAEWLRRRHPELDLTSPPVRGGS
jgi:hypothetical protein